jgi:predicted dehydrogenase
VRIGLFGTGYWATETWAPVLAAAEGVELAGVWGRNPQNAAALADKVGVRPFASVEGLVADVDAVAICLPPDVQVPVAEIAAVAGRHLLLEKPLALTLADANRVAAAVDRSGVASVVLFTGRFLPELAAWLDAAQADGRWHGGRAVWFAAPFQPDSPYRDSAWRKRYGALWDVGPHALSFLLPVLGPVAESPDAISAIGSGRTVHLALRHVDGASSTLSLSFSVPPAAARFEVALWGESGWSDLPTAPWSAREALQRAALDLVEAVDAGSTTHPCGVSFARDVVAVLDRAQRALPARSE